MSNPNDFVIENGVLKKYTGPGGDVVVPESVTRIGDRAFSGCSSLTSITLPEGVTSIGDSAFSDCRSLTSITLPESLTSIGSFAFSDCRSLTSITLPESLTSIGGYAFSGCRSLTSITLPESLTSIGSFAFSDCRSLTSITLPEGVTSIGDSAFESCSSLTSITLPDSISTVGMSAFSGCNGIAIHISDSAANRPENFEINNGILMKYTGPGGDVVVPDGVTSIGDFAFSKCSSLTSITLPEGVMSIGGSAFYDCSSLTSVILPKGLTRNAESTFEGCESLASIALPEGLTSIGDSAFRGCKSLSSITLPDSVTSIGDRAFSGCKSLTNVILPKGDTKISSNAFSGCEGLADANGFVIVGGILFGYTGVGGDVVVPKCVKSIGDGAFSSCKDLTSIAMPEGLTSIGRQVFSGCRGLADSSGFVIVAGTLFNYYGPGGDVVVPDGVIRIEDSAFFGCKNLTSITLPDGVKTIGKSVFSRSNLTSITMPDGLSSIGDSAFSECNWLDSITLPDGLKCLGSHVFCSCVNLTSIILPEGLLRIGDRAFAYCERLTSIVLPDSVTSLGYNAFELCTKLQWVKSPLAFRNGAAGDCNFALLITGDSPAYLAFSEKRHQSSNTEDYACAGKWDQYDAELIKNGPTYKYRLSARMIGALGRLMNPVELTDENRLQYAEFLNKNAKKLIALAEEIGDTEIIKTLFSANVLDENMLKAVKKLLNASSVPEFAALASLEVEAKAAAPKPKKKAEPETALGKEYAEKLKKIKGAQTIRAMKLADVQLPKIRMLDGSDAPEELFKFLLASYGAQKGWNRHFEPEADQAATLLSADSLCEALDQISEHLDGPAKPSVIPLLCRYGNEQQVQAMIGAWKNWGDWFTYGQKGRNAQWALTSACVLSDTRAAMLFAESCRVLDKYAEIRGTDADTIRDKYLSDVGLDEQKGKVYDLGNQTVTVRLQKDLSFVIELPSGKTAKSLPKKGADPAKFEAANKNFTEMKKSVKKILKNRGKVLFEDFLSGRERPSADWQDAYLHNPVLREAASLVVWTQGKQTFTLAETGPIDSAEQPYAFTEQPITVAHPMEMKPNEVTAWQKYITRHGLKQPFAQMWEPVRKPEEIAKDRYAGCMIPYYRFVSQEKHGIHVTDEDFHNEITIEIDGCDTDIERIDWQRHAIDMNDCFEVKSFGFKKYTRQVNHIVAYLDRVTVWDRVRKDDLTVMDLMPDFTLAQITEFISAAQETNATNVLAALLEYKNANFSDFDPMDEFTLEW